MSYETKQKQIAKEMQDLSGRFEIFTKSKEYSKGYSDCQKEYEDKLRWIPIDKLENPTIPFLGKDKFGKIELFKVANVFYLKAMDIVEWRSIL